MKKSNKEVNQNKPKKTVSEQKRVITAGQMFYELGFLTKKQAKEFSK